MRNSSWIIGLMIGVATGMLVASIMAAVDWWANPAGVFHGGQGTNWSFVWETWFSWFAPVFLFAGLVSFAVLSWWLWRK